MPSSAAHPREGDGSPSPAHDYSAEAEALAQFFDFTRDDVAASMADCARLAEREPRNRVAWFIPHAASPFSGGIHTVLRVANYLFTTLGVAQVVCVTGSPDAAATRAMIARAYPALAAAAEIVVLERIGLVPDLGPLDAAIATFWMTSLSLLLLRNVQRKYCLLQDWEPEFYPAGSTSSLVEGSYRFGFHAICGSLSLAEAYRALGGTAEHFDYAVDPALFHARRPSRAPEAPWRLFCYGRPAVPRNCYELAAAALRDIKGHLGDRIDIVLAGGDWDPAAHGLAGTVRNLGMIPHDGMADVYRAADVAICLTASRNPSIVMLELMACGTPVVTIRNHHHTWLPAGSDVAFECDASRSEIANTAMTVLQDAPLRQAHVSRGLAVIAERFSDWTPTCARIARAIMQPPTASRALHARTPAEVRRQRSSHTLDCQ
ncbi:MAG TPA: glycosyltransferase family 4 protein [Rhodopila sp.]